MNRVVIITGGNGDNIGNDIATVKTEIERYLGTIIAESSVRESSPCGFTAERDFLNQVLVVSSELEPYAFLKNIWRIEQMYGRVRGTDDDEIARWEARKRGETGYSSRNMDIDILFWNDDVISTPLLQIPHPLICHREFVLYPLKEVIPDFIHPVEGVSVSRCLDRLLENNAIAL